MNKLERAISLTMSDDISTNNMYSSYDPGKSMEEISKMEDAVYLTEDERIQKKIIFQGSDQDKLVNQLRDIRTA